MWWWCEMASEQQADRIISSLVKFEALGGLLSGTESSRGRIFSQGRTANGITLQLGLLRGGMQKYGYFHDAQRVAYRWLYMVTIGFVEAAVRRRSAYASRRPRANLCGLTLALARGAAASLDLSPFSSLSSPANYTV
ncbi:BZ3501_MvSof-1269-A2-R1_Chr6-2g08453 [Microbotryum saponariae]|nr:BZ3501_MvSof-1269-A2-R1_Chr6-2g08453 [Microbotryum saponariae]